jgi:hypothetical protein
MTADSLISGYRRPLRSMLLVWARQALVTCPRLLMAAGAAPGPNPSTPAPEETAAGEGASKRAKSPPIWWQAALYGTLLGAMLTNRYLRGNNYGVPGSFFSTAYLLQDAVAALTAFPMVYSKLQIKSNQPLFAQLGVIFTAGMGWQQLIYSVSPRG